ncbi:hypothetical protein [Kribbia dieselivorans]|uniref:hypothetical protein n=1 Tax=Kribbia dieselivorans TaxID=331526 RepID=UPI00083909D5|nr:hypothetical protein [Kribbia dieselivorans]
MEAIRDEFGLTALRIGHQLTRKHTSQVTFALRSPGDLYEAWDVRGEAIITAASKDDREAFTHALADSCARLAATDTIRELQAKNEPLWLAVTAEHPLLPGMAWEDAFGDLHLPLLRLPGQLNTLPTAKPSAAPRIAICVSMPLAKAVFDAVDMVDQALDALETLDLDPEIHVFADAETTDVLREQLSHRVTAIHDPAESEGSPGISAQPDDGRPWLGWIGQQMGERFDILHLIGHGFLSSGEGAFAVAESPTSNRDPAQARFLWPQQIAALMTSCGVWGLVATAVPQNHSTTGLRVMATQVSALSVAATIFHDAAVVTDHPGTLGDAYRLMLKYPASAPADTRGLLLIMHPMRFGMAPPQPVSGYHPAETRLATEVETGAIVTPGMVAAQNQVRQWETQLQFDSTDPQVTATRDALEVAKARLDAVMFDTDASGAGAGGQS